MITARSCFSGTKGDFLKDRHVVDLSTAKCYGLLSEEDGFSGSIGIIRGGSRKARPCLKRLHKILLDLECLSLAVFACFFK